MNKKEKIISKLKVKDLFVKVPMNLKCLLASTERDFLEAVIHLQTLGKYHTSDSLIMANSGLNSRQITEAKRNLIALDLISVATNKSSLGSRYRINECTYNELLRQLNGTKLHAERFKFGDAYRSRKGLKPIFKNIIHTLERRLKTIEVPEEERITVSTPIQPQDCREEGKERLKKLLDEGVFTPEQYHKRLKEYNKLIIK